MRSTIEFGKMHCCSVQPSGPCDGDLGHSEVRVVRLGFEVRIDGLAGGHDVLVQATRGQVDRLGLHPGTDIYVRPVTNAV